MEKFLVHNPTGVVANEVKPGLGTFVIQPGQTIEVANEQIAISLVKDSGYKLEYVVVEDGIILDIDLNISYEEARVAAAKKLADKEIAARKEAHDKELAAAEVALKEKIAAADAEVKEAQTKLDELKKVKLEGSKIVKATNPSK